MSALASAPIVVVMGVSGCGKSTIGAALADRLRVPFQDADDLHPVSNVDKMAQGVPLTDADRAPWLCAIGGAMAQSMTSGLVVACSALRLAYRDTLRRHSPDVYFLHLSATRNVLAARMVVRSAHFMPLSLLESQLATLEPLTTKENGLAVDAELSVDRILGIAEPAIRAFAPHEG
ncbi:gluconokinase [Microbacterium panaciterrae]|uniref:Gluconokinase n=1 Tax=Microbacterium panaciterrae TaxID=985759 RepID=A0ABP8P312_9MICO